MQAYIYNADIYCSDCKKAIIKRLKNDGVEPTEFDSETWPQGPYENGGGEADSPNHCGGCHIFMENPLTSDGVDYVKHWVNQTPKSEVTKQWEEFYDYIDY